MDASRLSPGVGCTVVDVAVEVPKEFFQEKDYLHYRPMKRMAYFRFPGNTLRV